MAATDATKFLNKTEYENALARIKSYIDGVTPTKLSELTDDIVTGHYLPLAGGTITGALTVTGNTTLGGTLTVGTSSANKATTLYGPLSVHGASTFYDDAEFVGNVHVSGDLVELDGQLVVSDEIFVTNGLYIDGHKFLARQSGTNSFYWDSDNNAWRLSGNFIADGFISAGGVSRSGGSGGGTSDAVVLRSWSAYNEGDENEALGSNLGMGLKTDLDALAIRVTTLESVSIPSTLDDITDGTTRKLSNYLPLAGGTLTGPLKWHNATALPATSSAEYFLAIDAFSSGGQTKYITAANLASSIGLDDYLPLAGGTMTGRIRWVGTDVVGNKEGGWNISGNQNGIQTLDDTVTADTGSPGRYSSALHVGGYYAFQIANDRTNLLWRSSPGNATAWRTIYDDTNLTKSVLTTLLANTYAPYNANGYLPLSGGTLTGNLTISKDSSAELNIATNTTGVAALTLTRGTQGDGYVDWRMINDGGSLYFKRNVSGTWTDIFSANATDLKVGGNNVWHAGNLTPLRMYQYAVTGARNFYWVRINDTSSWSGSFTVKVYDGYHFEIYEISGYNYTNSTGWYNARARLLLSSSRSSVSVVFGYTAAQELWFVIPTVTTGSGQPHRLMICDYNGTNLQEDVDFSCTTVTSMDEVEGTEQSTVTCSAYLTTSTGVTISTDQTISGIKTFSGGTLTISTATTGAPTLVLQRGTTADSYVDWKVSNDNGTFRIIRSASGTDTNYVCVSSLALFPSGTLTSGVSDIDLGGSSNRWGTLYTSAINASGLSTLAGGIVLGTSTKAVSAKMEWDETNNAWKLNGNFYATGFVSAGGISTSGSSGGDSDVNVIRNWSEYVATDISQALGANLGYSLKSSIDGHDQDIYELDNRVTALEQGGGGGGGGTTTDPTLRMYPTTTNAWYPVLTRYNTTSGSTYYTEYGRYATAVSINPSNGSLSATNISALNSIDTQGSLDIGLDATIGGNLTVTGSIINVGDSTFQGVTSFEDSITIDGTITLLNGQSSAEYQYPRYKLCASEAAYNAITTKQIDVLYLIPE